MSLCVRGGNEVGSASIGRHWSYPCCTRYAVIYSFCVERWTFTAKRGTQKLFGALTSAQHQRTFLLHPFHAAQTKLNSSNKNNIYIYLFRNEKKSAVFTLFYRGKSYSFFRICSSTLLSLSPDNRWFCVYRVRSILILSSWWKRTGERGKGEWRKTFHQVKKKITLKTTTKKVKKKHSPRPNSAKCSRVAQRNIQWYETKMGQVYAARI